MTGLYHAHSGLRYLVLVAGVIALVVFAIGLFKRHPYGRPARIAGASFTGLLHLQVLLGLALLGLGDWHPAVAGHLMMMLLAAVAAPLALGRAKRSTDARRAHVLALGGTLLVLLLIVGGVMAIGRSPLEARVFAAAALSTQTG